MERNIAYMLHYYITRKISVRFNLLYDLPPGHRMPQKQGGLCRPALKRVI